MLSTGQALIMIFVAAFCTFATRLFPFVVFRGKKEVPRTVRFLGNTLPKAVMALLIVYSLKLTDFTTYPNGLPEIIAAAVVIALHIWKRNNLLSIGAGTVCYMVLVQFLFV